MVPVVIKSPVLTLILSWESYWVGEPTESGRVTYPEDDTDGVLTKLFVLPLLSALLRCFWRAQSTPAPAPFPLPVLDLECRGVFRLHPGELPSHCFLPSDRCSRLSFLDPQAPGLFFLPGLSSLGEPSGEEPRVLLLLCSESRLSAWGSHSKSVSGKWGRMTVCWSYTLGMREMVDERRGLLLGLGNGVSSIKLITSSRLKHRSSSS